jgi:hypothetical protein
LAQIWATFPLSAGTLTVQGGSIAPPLTLNPAQGAGNTTAYVSNLTLDTWFTDGQVLSIAASGDAIPPFGPELVTAPAPITLLKPAGIALGGNIDYDLATSSDLEVAWSGGEQGADVILRGLTAPGVFFLCQWDATIGHGTVPRSMLAPLAKRRGMLDYCQERSHLFTAGRYTIGLYAQQGSGGYAIFE